MKRWSIPMVLGLLLAWPAARAAAGQPDLQQLLKVVEEQNKKIQALSARVQQLEADQEAVRQSIVEEVKRTDTLASQMDRLSAAKLVAWAEKVKWSGDLRYRHEFFDLEADRRERNRHRIRARLQLHATPSDELDLIFRLASGSDDPVSTNQTLTDGFSSKHLWLDLAYFDWHPESLAGLHLLGGKMKNPFFRPGKTELLWDGDLNPEGLAATYSYALSETTEVFAAGGGVWAAENGDGADNMLYGAQLGLTQEIAEDMAFTLGASLFHYTNTAGETVLYDPEDSFGNTGEPIGAGPELAYVHDYHLAEAFAQFDFKVGSLPVSLFGDYVQNSGSGVDEDRGWLVGGTLGKTKAPGSWAVGYNYRDLEADAVLAAFTDSDFIGGGTDGRGHEFSVKYQITRHARAAVTYFLNEQGLDDMEDFRRLQVDLQYKF